MQPSTPARTARAWGADSHRLLRGRGSHPLFFLSIALALCVLTLSLPTPARAQSASTVALATVISPDGLNLRAAPNTSSPVLTTIPFATVVAISGAATADNWYPLRVGPLTGWALGDFLSAGEVDPATAQSAPPLTATTLSLGSGPAADAATSSTAALVPPTTAPSSAPPAPPAPPPSAPPSGANAGSPISSYTATASYYGIDDSTVPGQIMACGAPFDPFNAGTVATNDWPCGTRLRVTGPSGNSIDVTVTDHGDYSSHWLDLTYAAFGKLADHKLGTIRVSVSVLP